MKFYKRLMAVTLSILLAIVALSIPNSKIHATTSGDYEYKLNEDNTIMLVSYLGDEEIVTIPTTIDNKIVTSLADRLFDNSYNIQKVVIPETITYIDDGVFTFMHNLEVIDVSVGNKQFACASGVLYDKKIEYLHSYPRGKTDTVYTMPSTVKGFYQYTIWNIYNNYLEKVQFSKVFVDEPSNMHIYDCNSIKEFSVPEDNNKIVSVNGVLYSKDKKTLYLYPQSKLDKIYNVLPSVKNIEEEAFYRCENLTNIKVSEGVITIGKGAFSICSSLKDFYVPASVVKLNNSFFNRGYNDGEVFGACNSLEKIEVSPLNKVYSSESGILYNKNKTILFRYPSKKVMPKGELKVRDGIQILGEDSFEDTDLEKITLPENLKTMTFAFTWGNMKLKELYIPRSVTDIYGAVSEHGINEDIFNIKCYKDTSAYKYAMQEGYKVILLKEVNPTSVKINRSSFTLKLYGTTSLKATVYPINASQVVSWRSGNSSIATVSKSGVVTAKKAGTTYIYVKAINGKEVYVKVTVTRPTATSVKLNATSKTLITGASTVLKAYVNPTGALQTVSWRSSNTKIVSVDKYGKVRAKKVGSAYIYATTSNGKSMKAYVRVLPAPTKIKLNYTSKTLKVRNTITLKATLTPKNTLYSVTWSSSNSSVATVSKTGKVTTKKKGTAYIYAKTLNGKTVRCKIIVK